MSALLRLYPRPWRDRYGDELEALLEEHPPTLADHFDLIRGALDARLHPQVQGADTPPEQETPMNNKLLGLLAAIGGLAWLLTVVTLFVMPLDAAGERNQSVTLVAVALAMALTGVALGELGTRPGSPDSTSTGHKVAILSVVFGALMPLPWPGPVIGGFAFPVLGVIAAWRGATNGTLPRWFVAVFVVGAVASTAAVVGQSTRNSEFGPFLIVAMGLAALALAVVAIGRRGGGSEVSRA
jgi:hypothetical protein